MKVKIDEDEWRAANQELATLRLENKQLQTENNRLIDTLMAAGFIGQGTQIIGDKRYEELMVAESKLKELQGALSYIKDILEAATARPKEIAVDWKECLVSFVEQTLKGE